MGVLSTWVKLLTDLQILALDPVAVIRWGDGGKGKDVRKGVGRDGNGDQGRDGKRETRMGRGGRQQKGEDGAEG